MPSQHIQVQVPATVLSPRGAAWAAGAAVWLLRTLQHAAQALQVGTSLWRAALWRALQAHGKARARPEMRRLAEHYEATRPELARALREAVE